MRTLLLSFVCLLSACAATESGLPTENLAETGGTAETTDTTAESRRGRRAALWTGIGFALYAIYEANDGDTHDALPTATTPTLDLGSACGGVKCW